MANDDDFEDKVEQGVAVRPKKKMKQAKPRKTIVTIKNPNELDFSESEEEDPKQLTESRRKLDYSTPYHICGNFFREIYSYVPRNQKKPVNE